MAKGKFKKRMSSPVTTTGVPVAVLVVFILFFGVPAAALARGGHPLLAAVVGFPLAAAAAFWTFGRILLVLAAFRLHRRGVAGVLVYSNSPTWQAHIEREWLPLVGGAVVTLNWSERATWRDTLPVMLWRHFCANYRGSVGVFRNINPAVIVLRGLRQPLVFRFYGPFELAKHGDTENLKTLEREMLEAVGAAT
ncbi:hypothetical protein AnaeK_3679 [Anaeromyxobacter sp. K]|uniref:hypothetical protein n=1 Tax=Anaeromyxobacter sp. (strain K) TaxID=447217 RepID=UPI00015F82DC|nr:hypothetical protein [Anaeromyxobacter sp. K]ACG74891.1 hypothetical protein AnaeK_3679 [Anaeromyxobacter sp. K]